MPFALILIGLVLIVSGVEGTELDLGKQLKTDFTGSGSYLYWAVAIVAIGVIGYVNELKKFSDVFMALLLVSLVFHNGGVFSNANKELASANNSPVSLPETDTQTSSGTGSSGSSNSSGSGKSTASSVLGDVVSAIGIGAMFA
ncbi:MAG: hypothetical protein P4N59_13135 [Negativicutes bacterium]|nr:hypothetical protein [Negativicutes bacterium]